MTTIPVDFTANDRAFSGGLAGNAVPHKFALFAHVGNRERLSTDRTRCNDPQHSRVVRLPAASGIERRLVECYGAVTPSDDPTFERREVRVAQVEQFGQ
jgi:hypothetical protein